jgi:hypothetical protein
MDTWETHTGHDVTLPLVEDELQLCRPRQQLVERLGQLEAVLKQGLVEDRKRTA